MSVVFIWTNAVIVMIATKYTFEVTIKSVQTEL